MLSLLAQKVVCRQASAISIKILLAMHNHFSTNKVK